MNSLDRFTRMYEFVSSMSISHIRSPKEQTVVDETWGPIHFQVQQNVKNPVLNAIDHALEFSVR
jgi:hypothetical protein